jgi:hypothetical protein
MLNLRIGAAVPSISASICRCIAQQDQHRPFQGHVKELLFSMPLEALPGYKSIPP